MTVRVERDGGVLRLVLDAPERRNALDPAMMGELLDRVHGAAADDAVRVVLLTGTGRAFCAGADVGGVDAHERYDAGSVDAANDIVRALVQLDRPVVCGLNGVAAGVGLSLALACDLVVATASASLTVAFTRIGLMPDGGASALLAASVGRARAMRLALTSERLSAGAAHDLGLVSHLLPDDEYAAGLERVVDELAAGAPLALAATKKAVNAAALDGLEAAFARERSGQSVLLRTADAAEGMAAFGERRAPRFEGR
ncbi:enoyl-CoA hydratase-related protein [Nocardioides marmoraquaticus]